MAPAQGARAAPAVSPRAGCAAVFALLAAFSFAQEREVTTAPGREISFPSSEVKDTFFAYALGIIGSGAEFDVDNAAMRTMFVEFNTALGVPFDLITRFSQTADPDTGERLISLDFVRDVVIPVPFSLLFYHPGSIYAAHHVGFTVHRSTWVDPDAGQDSPLREGPVYSLDLTEGSILVDIDDWLEALFSASLEDAWINAIVFFRWHGDWIGMLAGTGRRTRRVLRAYFDFTRNAIVFPVPASLNSAGRELFPD
jgi:hypothetical protein